MYAKNSITVFARRRARVEIIPLIDVIFFLLATFVLFTLSLNRIKSVPIVLPVPGKPDIGPEVVRLQVTNGGAVYWNAELIEAKEIPARLEFLKAQDAEPRIFISTDDQARLGPAIAVLDQVRRAGITKYSVETRPHAAGK